MVRTGLRLILGGEADFDIVGEAEDGLRAMDVISDLRPDVVLLDIRMPNQDGLTTTELLRAQPGPPRILVLTTFDADDMVLRALRLGADGFLLKDTPPPRMIEAVRAVAKGEPALSPSVTRQVIAAATGGPGPALPAAREELGRLTERELEVAVEVAHGRSNAEIAERLYMSVATVKANITRIFAKLGTDNRVQVAMKVRDAGLL
ncbi:DNA-binding response regulator [Microbispora siamensis]|uniref:DNA-binding response regulator n=2 Tax=Microbispora siamensis TaxID=564413 RepID=A0ABQ4GHI1_9ACTN|nr:DNA-binding response regulator [Microbispora siamensis]